MRPLAELELATLRGVRVVLADIDDTITTDGRLTAEAYAALEALHRAGLRVIPVTGRPAGWCDHIARMWPVDGVVGENGALYFRYDHDARRMLQRFEQTPVQRATHRARLDALRATILREVPGSAVASDQGYREADLAIDFCEDVAPLDDDAVDRIVALFEQAGAVAKVSSIHVNGWFGDYDKLGMTRRLLRECFDFDLDARRGECLYVGDSPNDAPMFGFFPLSVGVANVRDFGDRLTTEPAHVTAARAGRGFAELAARLLDAQAVCEP